MTSIHEQFTFSQPATMTDDNMEITSENGEEDIDIDLDLPQDHHDEDEVLEDAKSDVGLDEDYDIDLGSSPVLAHDDLMVDEENHPFAMNDASDELVQTDTIHFANMSAFNQTNTDSNDTYSDPTLLGSNAVETTEADWEQAQGDATSIGASYVGLDQQQGEGSQDETEGERNIEVKADAEPSLPASSPAGNDTVTEKSHKDEIVDTEPTPITLPEPHDEKVSDVSENEVAEDDAHVVDKVDFTQTEDLEPTSATAGDVVVMYRDAEYSLVASSELDDPDSYFLKDDSMTSAPLSEFLFALKEVIRADLSPDDELCLAIEDFGVEINEVSSHNGTYPFHILTESMQSSTPTFQMTFASIIDLHTRLLRNDGTSKQGPLYISVGTKPNFSKRLAALAAGAAEGKGLSELATWDDSSDSFQEEHSGFVEDGPAHFEGDAEEESFEDDDDDEAPGPKTMESRQLSMPQDNPEELDLGDETAGYPHQLSDHEHPDIQAEDEVASTLKSTKEEEDDLIDYEDEEFEQTRQSPTSAHSLTDTNGIDTDPICLKPAACFCAVCTEAIVAEYEEINEDLRRRSLSRAAEDLEGDEPSATSQEGLDENDEPLSQIIEDETGPLEDSEVINYGERIDLQEQAHNSERQDEGGDESPTTLDSPSGGQHAADDVTNSFNFQAEEPSVQEDETDGNDYFELNGEDELYLETEPQNLDHHETQNDSTQIDNSGLVENGADFDEINYEEAEEAPKPKESAPTLVHEDAETSQTDEIGYEDDDEPTVTDVSDSKSTITVTPITVGITSKRPRVDGEDAVNDDMQGMHDFSCPCGYAIANLCTSDTKRLRS